MFARLAAEPLGTFKLWRDLGVGARENIKQHLANGAEIRDRIRRAVHSGFAIEVISLRMQVIDLWLRYYFVDRTAGAERRPREFGRLIERAAALGMPVDLHKRLSSANKHRIGAVHGYMVGTRSYAQFHQVGADLGEILEDVVEFVVRNSGEEVTRLDPDGFFPPGSFILHVEGFISDLRSGRRY